MDKKAAKEHSTLVLNCLNIFKNDATVISFELTQESIDSVIDLYTQAILADVLPFFDQYSSQETLRKSFEDLDPLNWVTSDRMTRYTVLLSIYTLQNNNEAFEEMAKECLLFFEKPHMLIHKPTAESIIIGLRTHLKN